MAVHDSATAPFAGAATRPVGAAGGRLAAAIVHVNVSVAVAVPSLTVIVTLYGPAVPVAIVPLMTPVPGAIDSPVGRPVALKVSVSVSASVALASSDGVSPSVFARSWKSVLMTGELLTTVTGLESTAALSTVPSLTVARTRMRSPWSPLPACERSSVELVAPAISRPLSVHW